MANQPEQIEIVGMDAFGNDIVQQWSCGCYLTNEVPSEPTPDILVWHHCDLHNAADDLAVAAVMLMDILDYRLEIKHRMDLVTRDERERLRKAVNAAGYSRFLGAIKE